jgi:hypothetical protein
MSRQGEAQSSSMSSKTILKKPGKELRQYPAKVGYHGSDDETRLSPEE